MSNLSFRRPPWIIHDQVNSWSGKYVCFLGHHYHDAGKECWVVAAYNIVTSNWVERHFNLIPFELPFKNTCTDPKAEALVFWNNFSTKMAVKPDYPEETDEWEKTIKPYLERERKRQGIKEDETGLVC